jgi:hypothetical protein
MQRRRNMPQFFLFVNILTIFLSLFLIVTGRSMLFFTPFLNLYLCKILSTFGNIFSFNNVGDVPCNSDRDCPMALSRLSRCNDGFCEYRKCGPIQENLHLMLSG